MRQADEVEVYRPPNIRDVALNTLIDRTVARQQRRLLVAIETNQLKAIKLEGLQDKELVKFQKLIEKIEKRLNKVLDELEKADQELGDARQISNHITVLGETLGTK